MEILFAVLILFAVALVCGILLVLAEHYMGVPVDETAAKLRECLPGANCGACGYTGCDGYAAALAEGGVKTNLCVPGGQAVATALAEVLGSSAEECETPVAFVKCNGSDDVTHKCAPFEGVDSCRASCLLYAGGESCIYSCLGCGDCAEACPSGAICLEDGIARIDSRLCIGCGLCAKICPKHVISMISRKAKVAVICSNHDKGAAANKICAVSCIACRKCEKTCPNDAIKVENNLAVIDYSKCISCGACADVCPKKCIKHTDFVENVIL